MLCCGAPPDAKKNARSNAVHPEEKLLGDKKSVEIHAAGTLTSSKPQDEQPPHEPPKAAEKTSHASRHLLLLHFNDVYNIEPASRQVKSMQAENPLVVFSGDAFNPSLLSTVTLGAQMPPVLNEIGVHVACVGNHDLDFGVSQLLKLVKQCNFPWLMANVLDKGTRKPFANSLETCILERNGIKVGFAGLVEEEWLETLGAVNPEDLVYVDFVEEGKRLAKKLKDEGAELLIAVTHMRVPNDLKFAAQVPEFHIVMGGHDHDYFVQEVAHADGAGQVLVVKSGTDFRDLTRVDVEMPVGERPRITWSRMTMEGSVPQDPEVEKIVDSYVGKMKERMSEVIGNSTVELDGRFATVRTAESNLGNLICDVLRKATETDIVVINGGTFRSDVVHPAGPLSLGDLVSILPMMDPVVVLECTGEQILAGLENGVSSYPKLEGRFPQISGLRFKFDPAAPPKARIVPDSVTVGGEPLQMERKYRVGTKTYVAEGKDGYDMFRECKVLVDEEAGVLIPTAMRNHFRYIEILNLWDPRARVHKFAKLWSQKTALAKMSRQDLTADISSKGADASNKGIPNAQSSSSLDSLPTRSELLAEGDSGMCLLDGKYCVAPVCDGRITMV